MIRYLYIVGFAAACLVGACTQRRAAESASEIAYPRPVATGHNLERLIELAPGVYSGSGPAGSESFAELERLGVRTIVSVDGAEPDVESARGRGMRYVHVPIHYSGVPDSARLALAKALRDLPRPIYFHCHHGQHRGPAAAAVAARSLGLITGQQALELLDQAGTSPSYSGLFECVRDTEILDGAILDRDEIELPEVATVSGLVETMAEIDRAYDHLTLVRRAGWVVPADHPDLVPSAEAGRLAEMLRVLADDAEISARPADFQRMLRDSAAAARRLEEQILARAHAARLDEAFGVVQRSCTQCHAVYRDPPP